MTKPAVVAVVLLAVSLPAFAQTPPSKHSIKREFDVGLLNSMCEPNAEPGFNLSCRAYLMGAIRGIEAGDMYSQTHKNQYQYAWEKRSLMCIPAEVPLDMLVDYVIKALAQAKNKTMPATAYITATLSASYPCDGSYQARPEWK